MTQETDMPERLFAWFNEFGDVDADVSPDEYRTCTEYVRESALKEEIKRLCELLYGARCVYCGEVVGKETLSQDLADEVLRKHVLVCEKHPASALKERLERAEKLLKECEPFVRESIVCIDPDCVTCKNTQNLLDRIHSFTQGE